MKKQIIFFLKKFILFSMIFCVYIFSYGSLSASDGSNFITKTEFDNALTDFSSRLTTFESGINSKIDSQVTSYLDRNGIWNGDNQVLNSNTAQLKKELFNAPNTNATTGIFPNTGGEYKIIDNLIYIPKVSKTGMLVGSWAWNSNNTSSATRGGNDNNTRWGFYGNMQATDTIRSNSGFFLVLKFDEYSKTNSYIDTPYSAIVLQAQGDSNGNKVNLEYNVCASISTTQIVVPYKFFVNKDSCIKWSLILYYRFFGVGTLSPRTDQNSKISIFLNKAVLY